MHVCESVHINSITYLITALSFVPNVHVQQIEVGGGGMQIVVPRNIKMPVKKSTVVTTCTAGQTKATIQVTSKPVTHYNDPHHDSTRIQSARATTLRDVTPSSFGAMVYLLSNANFSVKRHAAVSSAATVHKLSVKSINCTDRDALKCSAEAQYNA
jgi:molecular chaperone DnaK (HSP70)